jgi:hypothetical protein
MWLINLHFNPYFATCFNFFASSARGISPYEAANGKAKCGKNYIK